MNDHDRARLVEFMGSLERDLPEVMEFFRGGAYAAEIELASDAWRDISEKAVIAQCYEAVQDAAFGRRFDDAGLSGVQLEFKLGLIERAWKRWKGTQGRIDKRIRTWLEAVDVVLGSFAKVAPVAEILLEFKEGLQAVAGDDGEPEPERAEPRPDPPAPDPETVSPRRPGSFCKVDF